MAIPGTVGTPSRTRWTRKLTVRCVAFERNSSNLDAVAATVDAMVDLTEYERRGDLNAPFDFTSRIDQAWFRWSDEHFSDAGRRASHSSKVRHGQQ
ncbi:hypothetical protein GCM10010182_46310 [Actinomadura cremea]|nr:hypothetical protein GCM10010182_46310 [Actinomadura cremea]